MIPRLPQTEEGYTRVGLDAEALWWDDSGSLPWTKLALCFSYGVEGDVRTVVARKPGMFSARQLDELVGVVSAPDVVVVGHNVRRYDLDLLQGVVRRRLPSIQTIDTMNDIKFGRAYRNTLKAQCAHYGIQLKMDSPSWLRIIQGDRAEWDKMVTYCENDVECALALERALAAAGVPAPMREWRGKKAA